MIDREEDNLNDFSMQNRLSSYFKEEEFERGGLYSNYTIDKIFKIFNDENEKNFTDITILTFFETSITINYFSNNSENAGHSLMRALEDKDLDFNRNYLMCPIFSTPRMKKDETLKLSDEDKNGHWVLLICDFSSTKALMIDSLGPQNSQISENAVVNFVRSLFRAFNPSY